MGSQPDSTDAADPAELQAIYDELNALFYEHEPGRYLHLRLVSLMVLAGRTDLVNQALSEGIAAGGSRLMMAPDAEDSGEGPDDQTVVDLHLVVESQLLLHAAAEMVLLHFLAHASASPCPWLEVARMRPANSVERSVRSDIAEASENRLLEGIDLCLLGRADRPSEVSESEWSEGRAHLVTYLRTLARIWLDESALYNAAKHGGLALPTSDAVFQIATENGDGFTRLGHGRAAMFLDSKSIGKRAVRRKLTTQWIDVDRSLALVTCCDGLLRALWSIGRARYVEPTSRVSAWLPLTGPNELRSGTASAMRRFSRDLFEDRW